MRTITTYRKVGAFLYCVLWDLSSVDTIAYRSGRSDNFLFADQSFRIVNSAAQALTGL